MTPDPRIHVTLAHLRGLQGAAKGLNFLPRQPSASVLNGRHASRLRGRGLNFEEMRDYLPGDDIRSIDWKATARTGKAHVRVFTEERDRPALIVVDQRMSMFFGTELNMKSVTAAEAAAISAFRILDAGDRVGGIVFDDDQQVEVKPQRSQRAVFALLEAIAEANARLHADRAVTRDSASLNVVLGNIARLAHHDHLIIVLSDFDGVDETTHRRLSGIAAHNDLVLMLVHDPAAVEVRARGRSDGRVVIGDHAMQAEVDFSSAKTREALTGYSSQRLQHIHSWQNEINLSVLPLNTAAETLAQIRTLMGRTATSRRVR
ncbi:MAG: DUF58 domain-containing protein [Pseudomonadales bacterium]